MLRGFGRGPPAQLWMLSAMTQLADWEAWAAGVKG